MIYELRLAVVALASFGAASAAASMAAGWAGRRAAARRATSASTLFQLRLLPSAISLLVSLMAIASFERFEPRAGQERTGWVLLVFAAMAAAALLTMTVRIGRAYWTTRAALGAWMRTAEAVSLDGLAIPAYAMTSSFPIVAVVGTVRPRLIVARSVLEACSREQLGAILAHERCHVRRRDNARRVLMWAAPDALMWTAAARALRERWQAAAEETADAEAARVGPAGRLHLAEALIRVARLAPAGSSAADLPASALYRGENIEHRVRRLLDPAADFSRADRTASWLWTLVAAFVPCSLLALRAVHHLVEAAVAYLP
jgi:Zn-dependent protease with chaperone function